MDTLQRKFTKLRLPQATKTEFENDRTTLEKSPNERMTVGENQITTSSSTNPLPRPQSSASYIHKFVPLQHNNKGKHKKIEFSPENSPNERMTAGKNRIITSSSTNPIPTTRSSVSYIHKFEPRQHNNKGKQTEDQFYATASSTLEQHQVYDIMIPLINTLIYTKQIQMTSNNKTTRRTPSTLIYTTITMHQQLLQ